MKLDQRQNLHDMHEFDVGKGTISLTTSSISGKCFSRSVFDIMSKKWSDAGWIEFYHCSK